MLISALTDHVARYPDRPLPEDLVARVMRAARLLDEGATAACAIGIDYRRRDSALRRCAELVHDDPNSAPSTAAGTVLRAVEVYDRRGRSPVTEIEEAIEAARLTGPIPCSQRQHARILSA